MGDFSIGTAAEIAAQLDGVHEGYNWRCLCPVHNGHSLSITEGHDGKLLFHCFAGCEFADIVAALREYLGYDAASIICDEAVDYDLQRINDRIQRACSLYHRTVPTAGTIVEKYLRSRSITIAVPPVLRFLPFAPHRNRSSYPAMAALVVDVACDPIGVHLTYLAPGGNGKYPFTDKAMQRECRGPIRSGAVRLVDVSRFVNSVNAPQLLVAEGLETGLACMQLFDIPVWAALSSFGIAALELPPEIKSVVVACDNDTNNAGHHAATVAYYRWVAEGRAVQLIMPPMPGTDFNNILIERAGRDG